jgi:hypothetical protein
LDGGGAQALGEPVAVQPLVLQGREPGEPVPAQLEQRRIEISLVVELCDERCGGWIVAISDLPAILLHVDDPSNVADLILWLHRLANRTHSAAAPVSTTRRDTQH